MRSLLFTVVILLAVIALPANAQNGTEIAPAALEDTADTQQDYTSTYGAATTDNLIQSIFDDNSEQDSSLKLSDEDISQDQPAQDEVSGEKVISNLDALSNSSDSGSVVSSSSTGTEDIESGNLEQASQKEQLNQTASDINQYSSEFPAEEKEYTSYTDQVFSPGTTDIDAILKTIESNKQSDVYLDGRKNILSENGFLPETSLSQNNTVNGFLEWYKVESGMNIESRARTLPTLSSTERSEKDNENIRDSLYNTESNLKLLIELPTSPSTQEQKVNEIFSGIVTHLNLLTTDAGTNDDPLINLGRDEVHIEAAKHMDDTDNFGFGGSSSYTSTPKDYAVVVGINQYSDRRSLHASVNDAQEMASLLELYGYEVILLTDNTADQPTKHNILEGALTEIKSKPNRGKVVVYFSGHSEKDEAGNFYLIPRDADGNTSSYISEEELNRSIKGIKDLSLIVDACHSEELKGALGEGQWLLASSKDDEPSNENWMDSSSVFTYNLCEAIKERPKWGGELSFQDYFTKAREETVKWSIAHFLSQTPIACTKMNGRLYYTS